jgi:O-antigen/teichoic acid export membrane protein
MLLLGSFLFTGIVINMDAVYLLMSNGDAYRSGFWVVVFLGIAKLVDMATGLNSQIIGYSKYYKFNFYALIILGLSNAILNYFLIHQTGVSGAALATLISLTLFNMAKLLYVKKKFGIWPFTIQDLYIVILAGICGLLHLSCRRRKSLFSNSYQNHRVFNTFLAHLSSILIFRPKSLKYISRFGKKC